MRDIFTVANETIDTKCYGPFENVDWSVVSDEIYKDVKQYEQRSKVCKARRIKPRLVAELVEEIKKQAYTNKYGAYVIDGGNRKIPNEAPRPPRCHTLGVCYAVRTNLLYLKWFHRYQCIAHEYQHRDGKVTKANLKRVRIFRTMFEHEYIKHKVRWLRSLTSVNKDAYHYITRRGKFFEGFRVKGASVIHIVQTNETYVVVPHGIYHAEFHGFDINDDFIKNARANPGSIIPEAAKVSARIIHALDQAQRLKVFPEWF